MKVVAILCQRNGIAYLERCLDHLRAHGVDVYLMDNASTDGSAELARSRIGQGVVHVEHVPFDGVFRFSDILRRKQELVAEIDADWFMHHDVDEIREPPAPWSTLYDAIVAADAQGYNAIEFDEFVFLPLEGQDFTDGDHVAGMRHYYHFRPRPYHRLNAWKNVGPVDLLSGFGHRVRFADIRPFPTPFVLRHYVALSHTHVLQKFASRVHDVERIGRTSWHDPRIAFDPAGMRLPAASEMIEYHGDGAWDRSKPLTLHPFLSGPGRSGSEPVQSPSTPADRTGEAAAIVVVGAAGSGVEVVAAMLADAAGSSAVMTLPPADVAGGGLRALLEVRPGSSVVHAVRDGRTIAADRLASPSPSPSPSPPPDGLRTIDDLAVEWMWHVRQIRQQGQLAARIVEIRFEDVLHHPSEALDSLLESLGLDRRGGDGAPARPVDRAGEGSPTLAPHDRVRFERIAGETLAAFDYG